MSHTLKKGIDIVNWFLEMASKESRLLIIDGIFNGEEFFTKIEELEFTRTYYFYYQRLKIN